jgi:hypothetical protein
MAYDIPPFPKNISPPSTCANSIRAHQYAHPWHIKVLKFYIHDMDVECTAQWFGALTMTLEHHMGQALSPSPFPKIHPHPEQAQQCKGAPMCPSMAYQGAETLSIYLIGMWNALHGDLVPQPWCNI